MKCNRGFTLIELMVVVAIVGIMAAASLSVFLSSDSVVRNHAFSLRANLSRARSEAVVRGVDVQVNFNLANNSYTTCVDANLDGDCADAGDVADLKTVNFKDVQFFNFTVAAPVGPGVRAKGSAWLAGGTRDGVYFDSDGDGDHDANDLDRIVFDFNGASRSGGGEIYLYVPGDSPGTVVGDVMAVVVSQAGRITIERWRNNSWGTK